MPSMATLHTNFTMLTVLVMILVALSATGLVVGGEGGDGTIGFATLGRLHFDFDVYTVTLPEFGVLGGGGGGGLKLEETRVTLGESVSYNAQLVEAKEGSAIVERLRGNGVQVGEGEALEVVVYVSEVEGSPQIYIDIPLGADLSQDSNENILSTRKRRPIALREADLVNAPPKVYLNDRPSMTGDVVVFVSTEEDIGKPLQGWNAVYSIDYKTAVTKRLTPRGVTDYSPAVSPSGKWVAVASNEGRGWQREIEGLNVDLYVFKAEDGSQRRMVVRNAGWPTWEDESRVYFHRLADDGWWSVYRVNVSDTFASAEQEAERVTPSGVHAFTPAASRSGKWIAVATRRSVYRHIEIFDLQTKKFLPLTALSNPSTHHYSPFVSPSSGKIGYHRCRGIDAGAQTIDPRIEYVRSPLATVSLGRIDGSFPVISPDGSLIAYVESKDDTGSLAVMKLDGSAKRVVYREGVFGTSWDPTGKVVYVAKGPVFASVHRTVHILAISNADTADIDADESSSSYKYLTKEGTENNAFPSASPDGKYIVFRSGRSGHKNLYIMDAAGGEEKYLRRLTEGPWSDTMPAWSPDNEWIVFSSDRKNPSGERYFALYLIHPNGTGLHMLLNAGVGGLINHPSFSPDGKKIVFTSDYAGVSAEPISLPHMYQPYGEIFVINVDGTGLTRITHNAYEDGTPTWGRLRAAFSTEGENSACDFDDVWFLNTSLHVPHAQCQRRWDSYKPAVTHTASSYS